MLSRRAVRFVRTVWICVRLATSAGAFAGCAGQSAESGIVAPGQRASLFQRPWRWTDENQAELSFREFRGSPMVVTVLYTSCSRTCPRTVAKLRKVQEAFARRAKHAEFFLVTLDPAVDTPERLHEYKETKNLPASWHLLRGSRQATDEFADLLDNHVLAMDSHLEHEAKIVVFDGDGRATRSFECCNFEDNAAVP